MIALLLEIVLAIIFAVIAIVCFGIFRAMPFFTGLIGAFVLTLQFPELSNIIPGEPKSSMIALILGIELVILVLTLNEQTGPAMVKFSCCMFLGIIMAIIHSCFKCVSWQKAVFVTVLYLLIMGIIIVSNLESIGIESSGYRNILASIIVSFMYAASLGFTLLVILSAIWGQYIKLRFSGDFYASYDKVGMIVVIAVMAVTAIGCFVRDRLELV